MKPPNQLKKTLNHNLVCDSVPLMKSMRHKTQFARDSVTQSLAVAALLMLGGISIAGPSGLLAWGENQRLLAERRSEIAVLVAERDEIRNRVVLLDPANADPDLAGELLRSNLNVLHPDEMVMMLK